MSGPPKGWRLAVASVVFVAFALQSFVVQTHIHFTPDAEARLAAYAASHAGAHGDVGQSRHSRHAPGDDPADCPICQEILHSGQFVAPVPQLFLPPAMAVSTVAVVDTALPFIVARSHGWRGRAPPRI
jgi:hypothetical protein